MTWRRRRQQHPFVRWSKLFRFCWLALAIMNFLLFILPLLLLVVLPLPPWWHHWVWRNHRAVVATRDHYDPNHKDLPVPWEIYNWHHFRMRGPFGQESKHRNGLSPILIFSSQIMPTMVLYVVFLLMLSLRSSFLRVDDHSSLLFLFLTPFG